MNYSVDLASATAMCEAAMDKREARNPYTEAIHIVTFVIPKALCRPGDDFKAVLDHILDDIYVPMLKDDDFNETFIDEMKEGGEMIQVEVEVIAFCVLAVKAFSKDNIDLAWSFIADAQYWAGIVMMMCKVEKQNPASELAKYRHVSTREEREKIANYWRNNIDPKLSAQKAGDAIVMAEITKFSHKKIAEIVSALRKEKHLRKT